MPFTGYSGAENGDVGLITTWKPGGVTDPTAVEAPSQFLMAESDGLDASFAQIERMVYGGGRDSDTGYRTGKAKAGGTITTGLYADNGTELLVNALGNDTYTAAITADTSATITNSGGLTLITLVTGNAAYAPPCIVLIDTGANQECVPVVTYNAGTKQLSVPLLDNAHSSSGTAVHLVGQHLAAPYSRASGFGNQLRRMCIEDNVGDKYAYAYPNTMVGKWSLKASASKFEVSADVVCSGKRQKLSAPTAFDESDPSWANLSYEFTDGFFVIPVDPTDSGTATLQRTGDVEEWDVTIDNKMREIPCFDGTAFYRYFPGQRQVDVNFGMLNESSRPVGFEDFVSQNKDAEWFGFARQNVGTPTSPVWQAECFYAPNLRYLTSKDKKGLNDVVGETITARARKVGTNEKLYVAILNSEAAAY